MVRPAVTLMSRQKEFPNQTTIEKDKLICSACLCSLPYDKKANIVQHLASKKHKRKVAMYKKFGLRQQVVLEPEKGVERQDKNRADIAMQSKVLRRAANNQLPDICQSVAKLAPSTTSHALSHQDACASRGFPAAFSSKGPLWATAGISSSSDRVSLPCAQTRSRQICQTNFANRSFGGKDGACSSTSNGGNHEQQTWGQIISEWDVYQTEKLHIVKDVIRADGIPAAFRSVVWQLLTGAADFSLQVCYDALLQSSTPFEKPIRRDIARTCAAHDFFKDKVRQESLYNVVKAYAVYDREAGYCQGSPFVAGLLLTVLPELHAFCVLAKLMQDYGLREMFASDMAQLGLYMLQFECLVQEKLPSIFEHHAGEILKISYDTKLYTREMNDLKKRYLTLKTRREPADAIHFRAEIDLLRQRVLLLEQESADLADRLIHGQVADSAKEAEEDIVHPPAGNSRLLQAAESAKNGLVPASQLGLEQLKAAEQQHPPLHNRSAACDIDRMSRSGPSVVASAVADTQQPTLSNTAVVRDTVTAPQLPSCGGAKPASPVPAASSSAVFSTLSSSTLMSQPVAAAASSQPKRLMPRFYISATMPFSPPTEKGFPIVNEAAESTVASASGGGDAKPACALWYVVSPPQSNAAVLTAGADDDGNELMETDASVSAGNDAGPASVGNKNVRPRRAQKFLSSNSDYVYYNADDDVSFTESVPERRPQRAAGIKFPAHRNSDDREGMVISPELPKASSIRMESRVAKHESFDAQLRTCGSIRPRRQPKRPPNLNDFVSFGEANVTKRPLRKHASAQQLQQSRQKSLDSCVRAGKTPAKKLLSVCLVKQQRNKNGTFKELDPVPNTHSARSVFTAKDMVRLITEGTKLMLPTRKTKFTKTDVLRALVRQLNITLAQARILHARIKLIDRPKDRVSNGLLTRFNAAAAIGRPGSFVEDENVKDVCEFDQSVADTTDAMASVAINDITSGIYNNNLMLKRKRKLNAFENDDAEPKSSVEQPTKKFRGAVATEPLVGVPPATLFFGIARTPPTNFSATSERSVKKVGDSTVRSAPESFFFGAACPSTCTQVPIANFPSGGVATAASNVMKKKAALDSCGADGILATSAVVLPKKKPVLLTKRRDLAVPSAPFTQVMSSQQPSAAVTVPANISPTKFAAPANIRHAVSSVVVCDSDEEELEIIYERRIAKNYGHMHFTLQPDSDFELDSGLHVGEELINVRRRCREKCCPPWHNSGCTSADAALSQKIMSEPEKEEESEDEKEEAAVQSDAERNDSDPDEDVEEGNDSDAAVNEEEEIVEEEEENRNDEEEDVKERLAEEKSDEEDSDDQSELVRSSYGPNSVCRQREEEAKLFYLSDNEDEEEEIPLSRHKPQVLC